MRRRRFSWLTPEVPVRGRERGDAQAGQVRRHNLPHPSSATMKKTQPSAAAVGGRQRHARLGKRKWTMNQIAIRVGPYVVALLLGGCTRDAAPGVDFDLATDDIRRIGEEDQEM